MTQNDSKPTIDTSILHKYALDSIDQNILQLVIKYPAITDTEIAKAVGLKRTAAGKRRRQDKFQKALDEFYKEPLQILKDALSKAARVIVKSLDSYDERVKLSAAKTLLLSEGVMRQRVTDDALDRAKEVTVITASDGRVLFAAGDKKLLEKEIEPKK